MNLDGLFVFDEVIVKRIGGGMWHAQAKLTLTDPEATPVVFTYTGPTVEDALGAVLRRGRAIQSIGKKGL